MTTQIKERPIIFTGEMVRAIIDGRKTVTRRIVKPQPEKWIDKYIQGAYENYWFPEGIFIKDPSGFLGGGPFEFRTTGNSVKCPYGVPGDRLWVRETWGVYSADDFGGDQKEGCTNSYVYRADGEQPGIKWRSPIHLHRIGSRITLEVVKVSVERLQDISKNDCTAEGMIGLEDVHTGWHQSFAQLWDSINSAGSWDLNPWVWRVEFKKL